ncbi:hypothetical protein D018_1517A, partial [Vibrio parahaemolyticus VP2007-007]
MILHFRVRRIENIPRRATPAAIGNIFGFK